MDLYATVVIDKPEFPKFVHEKTYARPSSSYHLCKRLLADFRDHRLCFPFFAKVSQQQKQSGETFLTRIEQLVDKVALDTNGPAQEIRWRTPASGELSNRTSLAVRIQNGSLSPAVNTATLRLLLCSQVLTGGRNLRNQRHRVREYLISSIRLRSIHEFIGRGNDIRRR
jgi:hypothetical protein